MIEGMKGKANDFIEECNYGKDGLYSKNEAATMMAMFIEEVVNKNYLLPGVSPSTLLKDDVKFQKQLLKRWGFTEEGGIDCMNQLKIFSLLEWLEENQY